MPKIKEQIAIGGHTSRDGILIHQAGETKIWLFREEGDRVRITVARENGQRSYTAYGIASVAETLGTLGFVRP